MEFCDYEKNDVQIKPYNFWIGSIKITCNYTMILNVVLPKLHPPALILLPYLNSLPCDTPEIWKEIRVNFHSFWEAHKTFSLKTIWKAKSKLRYSKCVHWFFCLLQQGDKGQHNLQVLALNESKKACLSLDLQVTLQSGAWWYIIDAGTSYFFKLSSVFYVQMDRHACSYALYLCYAIKSPVIN